MAIKLAVSGAHSTGKSTFLTKVEQLLETRGIHVSIVKELAIACPLPILRDHTPESALWIVASGIAREIAAAKDSQVILVDRPVLDAWAYLRASDRWNEFDPTSPQMRAIKSVISPWLEQYDYWYLTQLDEMIQIEADKNRDTDTEYRRHVAAEMIEAVQEFGRTPRDLTFASIDDEATRAVNEIVTTLRK